jgi:hypothetical protein
LKAPHSKCGVRATVPGVRIPPCPPPLEALAAYATRVDRLVSLGGQGNYEGACKIIRRMQAIRKRLGHNADHAAYVADLKSRYKAKRNFIKLVDA